MIKSQEFSKQSRLLNAYDYSRVFDNVDQRVSSKYFLMLVSKNNLDHSRLGLIVAKKHVKLSVQRNRIKRQIRETYRRLPNDLNNLDIVVLAKKGASVPPGEECFAELNGLWKKLSRKQKL